MIGLIYSCSSTTVNSYLRKAKRTKSHDKKEKNYLAILEIESNNTFVFNRLGELSMNSNEQMELQKSRNYFNLSLKIDSNQSEIWYGIGYTFMREIIDSSAQWQYSNPLSLDSAIYYITKSN